MGRDKEFSTSYNSISVQVMPKAKYKYANDLKGDPTLIFLDIFHLELIFVLESGGANSNKPTTHDAAKDQHKFMAVFLPRPPRCCDYSSKPLYQTLNILKLLIIN